jgi:hypothetical protein
VLAQLLGDARKSWQYRVTDEVVYLPEATDWHGDTNLAFAKYYQNGNVWFDVLVSPEMAHFVAVVSTFDFENEILAGDSPGRSMGNTQYASN